MKKHLSYIITFAFIISLCSCIVQMPKYTRVEKVLKLELGMTKDTVSSILGIPPYDIRSVSDTTEIYIYKYRVTDRRTLPFQVKETNGKQVRGKFVDLFVTYSKQGKAIFIESCSDCEDTRAVTKKLDLDKLTQLVTVTLPVVLVYLGLK